MYCTLYTYLSSLNTIYMTRHDMLPKTKHQLAGMNEIFYVFESIMRVSRSDERCLYDPSQHAGILRYKCIMR